jgi:anti-sigma-K factor RskA
MSRAAGGKSKGTSDEILAGEYVLGVLPIETQQVLEKRMRSDALFAASVARWRKNLVRDDQDERSCQQEIYNKIYGEGHLWAVRRQPLFERARSLGERLWHSTAFWRLLTLLLGVYLYFEFNR